MAPSADNAPLKKGRCQFRTDKGATSPFSAHDLALNEAPARAARAKLAAHGVCTDDRRRHQQVLLKGLFGALASTNAPQSLRSLHRSRACSPKIERASHRHRC